MHGAAKSEEVMQRMMKIGDKCISVRGNREKYIIEGMPLVVHDEKRKTSQEELDRNEWIKNHLSKASIDFIQKMPKKNNVEIEGKRIYFVHYPMKEDGSFKKHVKTATLCFLVLILIYIYMDIHTKVSIIKILIKFL